MPYAKPKSKKAKAAAKAAAYRWNKKWPEKKKAIDANNRLQREYGISSEHKARLLAAQKGKCAACGSEKPGHKFGWAVDHNHRTKKLRGILCHGCNVALGAVRDDPERLLQLIEYLEMTTREEENASIS